MIRRIQGSEYLKRYDNMTAAERTAYEGRVGQWLSECAHLLAERGKAFEARMQNVQQVSVAWNDHECQAFEEGACLLSALAPAADTWLPDMLYVKSARRAVRQMVEVLWGVDGGSSAGEAPVAGHTDKDPKEERAEGTAAATRAVGQPASSFQGGAGDGDIAGGHRQGEAQVGLVPARPRHIDQYVHLLPRKTQEHAALVQGLYRDLDEARHKMELLMADGKASAADREAWAKKATKCDNALRKIFDELDAGWAMLVKEGRVVVDDLGNARVVHAEGADRPGPAGLTTEQRARRRELRKWLTDTRRGNGDTRDEHIGKWKANFREYLELEGDKAFGDDKVMEAVRHYGIDVGELRQ